MMFVFLISILWMIFLVAGALLVLLWFLLSLPFRLFRRRRSAR